MSLTLALLLGATLPASTPSLANLDFASARLSPWEGDGFRLVRLGTGSRSVNAVSSSGSPGKAILHRTFFVPASAVAIAFSAALYRPDGVPTGEMLDVVLEAANRELVPRERRAEEKWVPAPTVLEPDGTRLREYRWPVENYVGRRVRIAVVDSDTRPGCHVVVTGFRLVTRDEANAHLFAQDVRKLQEKHRLPRMLRYDSKHFMALSNADPAYCEYRLFNCETIYPAFFDHFRKRGFVVRPPAEKLMVALFNTQEGFDAYVGQKMPSSVTGLFHTPTNRLVVYDYATNRAFVEGKRRIEAEVKAGSSDLERERKLVSFGRYVRDRRDDTNISTIMHEVAHQLSFNCGLLNRQGDVPVWLAEGLAVYCEATIRGAWQGIGEPNPMRAAVLDTQIRANAGLFPIRGLVVNDDWIRKAKVTDQVVLGYSQSWALFRLLMTERPKQLRAYLQAIHSRRTPDHRLGDFVAAFGDMGKLDRRYQAYMQEIARKETRTDR